MSQGTRPVRPLYMDKSVIVVNKPVGVVSQIAKENLKKGSVDYVDTLRKNLGLTEDLWPAHRLDKVTTGALVLARSYPQIRELATQFRVRQVKKTYYALVCGGKDSFSANSGVLNDVIRYNQDGRFDCLLPLGAEKEVVESRKRLGVAETHWELIQTSPKAPLSLLKLDPVTGMKHQLRIQLAKVLKTPVLGELLYAKEPRPRAISKVSYLPKNLFLHASHISFFRYRPSPHPKKRYTLGVTAPIYKHFIRTCKTFGIDLPEDVINGGVYIDGEKVTEPAMLPDGGKWLIGPHTDNSDSE